jgi:hypothetical protein
MSGRELAGRRGQVCGRRVCGRPAGFWRAGRVRALGGLAQDQRLLRSRHRAFQPPPPPSFLNQRKRSPRPPD